MTWYELLMLIGVPSIISTLVTAVIIMLVKKSKKAREDEKKDSIIIKQSIQALLRNELLQSEEKFVKQGWVDTANKQNYDNMYYHYHSLGKNGVMDHIHDQVMLLPTEKPEKALKDKK